MKVRHHASFQKQPRAMLRRMLGRFSVPILPVYMRCYWSSFTEILKSYDAIPVQLDHHSGEALFWIFDKICGTQLKNCLCFMGGGGHTDSSSRCSGAVHISSIERYSGTRSWKMRLSSMKHIMARSTRFENPLHGKTRDGTSCKSGTQETSPAITAGLMNRV
jgi:hypothetical protein